MVAALENSALLAQNFRKTWGPSDLTAGQTRDCASRARLAVTLTMIDAAHSGARSGHFAAPDMSRTFYRQVLGRPPAYDASAGLSVVPAACIMPLVAT